MHASSGIRVINTNVSQQRNHCGRQRLQRQTYCGKQRWEEATCNTWVTIEGTAAYVLPVKVGGNKTVLCYTIIRFTIALHLQGAMEIKKYKISV
jgi:hypothetical protein